MNIINFKISQKINSQIRKGHPWIFENSIIKQSQEGVPGDIAVLYDERTNRFLAVGLYDPLSVIRIKILQANKPVSINADFFESKLKDAFNLRSPLFNNDTNGFRLIHGENDGFPGLVIDKYDKTLVFKIYSVIWIPYLNDLIKKILLLISVERIVLRCSRMVIAEKKYLNGLGNGLILHGSKLDGSVIFSEHGLKFEADVINGQKTGFFLDQRENRFKLGNLSKGKKVLNVFSYSGGFSVYAASGGAESVLNIDINQKALESVDRNLKLNYNNISVHKSKNSYINGDAFEELARLSKNKAAFDIVIIDPPSFAKKESEITQAIKAYEKLTRLGLSLTEKNGIFLQASCSSRISSQRFYLSITNIAAREKVRLKEIERTGHPLDHPIKFKEGEYLKCLFARRT